MGRKPKTQSKRRQLEKELESLCKQVIRLRDKGKCVVCGSTDKLGWGHVFSRSARSTRYDLDNIFLQCWPCNFKHTHDTVPYYRWYQQTFGMEKFDEVYSKFKNSTKQSLSDLETHRDFLEQELLKYA